MHIAPTLTSEFGLNMCGWQKGVRGGTSEKLTVREVLRVATLLNSRRRRPKSGPGRLLP